MTIQKQNLEEKWHFSSLEQIFIGKRIYRDIEKCETWKAVLRTIDKGLDPYKVYKRLKESVDEISTLGASGLKSFAKKHKYSVRSKKSGGRVPLMYLSKDGKQFGSAFPVEKC